MAKLLFLSLLLLFLVSCNDNPDCESQSKSGNVQAACSDSPQTPTDPEPEPEPVPGDLPNEALTFEVEFDLYKFDRADEDKIYKAVEIIKKVVGSEEFRRRVINYTYNGKKQYVDNNGLTNEEIYLKLLEGKEELYPVANNKMDLELELYYSFRSVVGYTTPGEMRIYLNTKFFDPYTPAEVAGNVFHEWIHKLGFDHDSSYSVQRDSSVPYAIGYIMEELGKKYE